MALTVETGAVIANADSYISVTDADAYFTKHGSPSDWTGLSSANKESALRYATTSLDSMFEWTGEIVNNTQALAWPRDGATDDDERYYEFDTIPSQIKNAECELALYHVNNALNASYERGGDIKREQVGPIVTEYFDGAPAEATFPILIRMVRGLGSFKGPSATIDRA